MEAGYDFFGAMATSLSLSFLRMVPLCALSPPWWRQCFHWLSSSVACWWKSQSLDWASLVGCRTPDVRLAAGWMKVGENLAKGDETWLYILGEHVSMDLSVVQIGQSKMCFC